MYLLNDLNNPYKIYLFIYLDNLNKVDYNNNINLIQQNFLRRKRKMKFLKRWGIRLSAIIAIGLSISWFWYSEWRKPPRSEWKKVEAKTKRPIKIYKQELKFTSKN